MSERTRIPLVRFLWRFLAHKGSHVSEPATRGQAGLPEAWHCGAELDAPLRQAGHLAVGVSCWARGRLLSLWQHGQDAEGDTACLPRAPGTLQESRPPTSLGSGELLASPTT